MTFVFLTLAYPTSDSDRNLYSDLMDELAFRGNEVIVFRPDESKSFGKIRVSNRLSVKVVNVPVGRITKAPILLKIINTVLLGWRYLYAVIASKINAFDVLIYSTPPITLTSTVERIKRRVKCRTYLLLKDIFPQNAVDLKMFKEHSLIWYYFRKIEERLYKVSDQIGCMSPANLEYCARHNPELPRTRLHICPNCINPSEDGRLQKADKSTLPEIGIRPARLNILYGGNLGKPQCIDFIIDALTAIDCDPEVFTTIIGSGTEYQKLANAITTHGLSKVLLLPYLPKEEYRQILACMDVGLVFLDPRFTIPNFPSRILDYMDCSIPILACTDVVSDIKKEICDRGCGLWCKSGDVKAFTEAVMWLKENTKARHAMGVLANELLRTEYSVQVVVTQMLMRLEREIPTNKQIQIPLGDTLKYLSLEEK